LPRYAKKIDVNQSGIVKALRKMPGVEVALDKDDILVGRLGKTYWYEIKSDWALDVNGKVRENNKQKSQKKLIDTWTGHYKIISSLDEILKDMGIVK
jgi:hypothetical protein